MSKQRKDARIDLRVTKEQKEFLEQVSEEQKTTLSNYIMSIVMNQAELDNKVNKEVLLNNEQWDYVEKLINNPPEPTQELKDLFQK